MSIWKPDFVSLRLFVAVCEEASIARAAERETIVPSAISKRIAELESAFGVELFTRTGRGMTPTVAGNAVLHHARLMLQSAEKLQVELGEYTKGVRGHVRVLANISSIVEFLPRDISAFLMQNPHIRVELQERVSSSVVASIRDGAADIGLCLGNIDTYGLEYLPYGNDRLALITHPRHPLAQRKSVSFDDILDYDLVGLQTSSRMTTFLSGLAAKKDRVLNYRTYVGTYEAACHVIAENLGIGILAVDAVRIPRTALGLQAIPLDEPWALRQIILCFRDYAQCTAPVRGLIDHLKACSDARRSGFTTSPAEPG